MLCRRVCVVVLFTSGSHDRRLPAAGGPRSWLGLKVLRHEAGTADSAMSNSLTAIKRAAARTNCTKRAGFSVKAAGGSTLTEMPVEVQLPALHR